MNSKGERSLVVLVVDDNVDAADSLADALGLDGDMVERAYGGLDAVRSVERLSPDVVVSDLDMPGMSGLDEARAIRRLSLRRQPWLVAVTGACQLDKKMAAFAAGFDFFLTKPTSLSKLDSVMEEIRLNGRR